LQRVLGRWDLTAIGVNQVIGGAIFLMPSQLAGLIGGWSHTALVLAGFASMLVALCFAEVGSRFEGTGGPYLYTRAALGRFVGFEVGWMQWFTRASSQASVVNGIALALTFYWPALAGGMGRALIIVCVTAALAAVNVRGIRQSAWVVNALTIGKLVPLGLFIIVGLSFMDVHRLVPNEPITWTQASTAALLLIFMFGGYDVVPVPAGEAKDPRHHVPFALVTTIVVVTVVFALAQAVVMSVLPTVTSSVTPIADAAALLMGGGGALLIGIGSVVSMTGNNAGQVLSASRMLFALAEQRQLPAFFGKVHPRFRTPANAVVFTSAVALVLALSGSFVTLAAASAIARLITYVGVSAATLLLRRDRFSGIVKPATFRIRFGPLVPVLSILVSLAILFGATQEQLLGGAAALIVGAILFFLSRNARDADLQATPRATVPPPVRGIRKRGL
jgi:amino acid transporter